MQVWLLVGSACSYSAIAEILNMVLNIGICWSSVEWDLLYWLKCRQLVQVPRSAASAVAFGMGLFEGKGKLGECKQRAFSVITDSRKDDIHLRFHESCMAYKVSLQYPPHLIVYWVFFWPDKFSLFIERGWVGDYKTLFGGTSVSSSDICLHEQDF